MRKSMAKTTNQSQYDFMSGSSPPHSVMNQLLTRESTIAKPDLSNEEWRVQIHKLQYELDSMKQERDATALRHEDELRRAQSRAEVDYKQAQASEVSKNAAESRSRRVEENLREIEERYSSEKADLERKLRIAQDEAQTRQEEVEDLRSEQSSAGRQLHHEISQLQARFMALEQTNQETHQDMFDKARALETSNQRLSQRETEVGELQNELLRLKTQVGDVDTLAVIKRELSEQVDHIRKLEATNLDQRIELKQLRKQQKAVEVVEEEKRVLESKLRAMKDLRKELGEAQLQKQILEDERRSWTAYLENEGSNNEDQQFETPEDLAKAYIEMRLENATLVDKFGQVEPELATRESIIESLEEERNKLQDQLHIARTSSAGPDPKSSSRLERQRALAVKEVEYLRAQFRLFDAEASEFQPERFDEAKTKRIQELEDLVDQCRTEIEKQHLDFSKREDTQAIAAPETPSSKKRGRDEGDDERLGELSRRNRSLQDQIAQLSTAKAALDKELKATKSQLTSLKSSNRTRILEFRNNPTANVEAVKKGMLAALRDENTALLARLESNNAADEDKYAPKATIERLRLEVSDKEAHIVAINKKTDRLKQVWGTKSREWRQTVAQTLGWDFDFMPNGRVRVTSTFNPGISEEEGGEGLNSIIFDGEKGTMKCSGGPRSAFAADIDEDIRFWVDDKREVPCFLATLTLKFWDDTTKAQRVI